MLSSQALLHLACPGGLLETLHLPAKAPECGVAVLHHPNPLQGGTFTNKTVQTAAKALNLLGFHAYLPNSRGTGKSEGSHDYGRGETEDFLAAAAQIRARHPDLPRFAIGGFSFGGYVAALAAPQCPHDLLLLVGAAVGHYTERTPAPAVPDAAKTVAIHGADDEVVPLQNVLDWAAPQDLPVIVQPGASHFFHGKLIQLRDNIVRFTRPVIEAA